LKTWKNISKTIKCTLMSWFHVYNLKKCPQTFMTMSRFTLQSHLMTQNVFMKNTAFFSYSISVQMSNAFPLSQLKCSGTYTFLGPRNIEIFVNESSLTWFFRKCILGTNQGLIRWKEIIKRQSSFTKLHVIKTPTQEFGDFQGEQRLRWNLDIWTYYDSATLEWESV